MQVMKVILMDLEWLKCSTTISLCIFPLSPFILPALSSNINSSPGYDRAIFLRLHVIVKICIHFLFSTTVTSADMIGWWKNIPTSTFKVAVLLVLFLCAFIHVKLFPLRITHLATQEDIMCGWWIWKMMVVILAGLSHQRPSGITAFPICVDGPIVVCASHVLARSTEKQPGFIAVVAAITASSVSCYGVHAAGVAMPLPPSTSAQENANERDNQKQGQEGANHGTCHDTSTEWLFQGFCRGDEGNRWRKRTKELFVRKSCSRYIEALAVLCRKVCCIISFV